MGVLLFFVLFDHTYISRQWRRTILSPPPLFPEKAAVMLLWKFQVFTLKGEYSASETRLFCGEYEAVHYLCMIPALYVSSCTRAD